VTKNLKNNGEFVNRGDVIAVINGPLDDILTCERLSLSYLRYMSGISTLVSKYLLEIPDLETELVYSGYATPCLDECSKQAFCDGGGVISEGISNLILISKNFSDHFDSFDAAIDAARKNYPAAKFNIEVTTIEEALEAMQTDCKVIRVSALKLEIFSQIAEINKGRKILEAFVEIDSKKIRYLARLGYQYVLIPSITDGAKSLSIEMCFYKRLKKLR
jgi:nicotinate-nucleotide pyrophosphorylase (carboxylating)